MPSSGTTKVGGEQAVVKPMMKRPPRDPSSTTTARKVRVLATGVVPLQDSPVTPEVDSSVTLPAFSMHLPTSLASPALSASSPIAPFSTMSVAQEVLVEMRVWKW
ncbi:unnamed protein product [Urochloa humidicola]